MHSTRKPGEPKPMMRRMAERLANAISPDPMRGREFDGFKIEEKIGRGGMATIYRAGRVGGGEAAVKILDREYCSEDRIAAHFMAEALILENIEHPNIVRGLGHGVVSGQYYIAMEHLVGQDLDSALRERPLPPDVTMRIIRDACRGLGAIHEKGIVHRDVKPANVVVGGDRSFLIDFGISKTGDGPSDRPGIIYGTINYLSPEQVSGGNIDGRSDIYSLGVTAYRAICGALPIESDDFRHLLDLIRMMTPRAPSAHVPGIPEDVDRIIMKAL